VIIGSAPVAAVLAASIVIEKTAVVRNVAMAARGGNFRSFYQRTCILTTECTKSMRQGAPARVKQSKSQQIVANAHASSISRQPTLSGLAIMPADLI
jgi:hypothetical protein